MRSGGCLVVAAILAAGCGRIGYDPVAGRPTADWARFVTAPAVYFTDVAVDGAGNVYAIGSFNGDAAVDETPIASLGPLTMFLASLDRAGGTRWVTAYGGTVDPRELGVDGGGSVYVAGHFNGAASFGETQLVSGGSQDPILLVHTSEGALVDLRRDAAIDGNAQPQALAASSDGSFLAVAGQYAGDLDVGEGPLGPAVGERAFIVALDGGLALRWAAASAGDGDGFVLGAALGDDGTMCVVGRVNGTVDLGGGAFASAAEDGFVASYAADGTLRWLERVASSGDDQVDRAVVTADGDCVVVGTFGGDLSIGGIALSGRGGSDGLVARFDREGATRWARSWGGPAADNGKAIAIDPAGGVAVAGTFTGEAELLVDTAVSVDGGPDLFVLGFDDDGDPRWLHVAGGTAAEAVFGLASDPDGGFVVGGRFAGTTALAGAEASSQGGDGGYVYRVRR